MDDAGIDGVLFQQGGNSLMTLRLTYGLDAVSGAETPLRTIPDYSTDAGLATVVEALSLASRSAPDSWVEREDAKLRMIPQALRGGAVRLGYPFDRRADSLAVAPAGMLARERRAEVEEAQDHDSRTAQPGRCIGWCAGPPSVEPAGAN